VNVTAPVALARRPRAFIGARGPDAAAYLNRMVSNDVETLATGASCDALLLTPKARIIATLRVLRRADDDFLLLTEPELGETVRDQLLRARFAAKVEIELESHASYLMLGQVGVLPAGALAISNPDYGVPCIEVIDGPEIDGETMSAETLELLRIEAGTPRFGSEIDERVLPAEAGLEEHAISFTKGCYPGQEPVARLHYRGHANRALRVLRIATEAPVAAESEILHEGRSVGRVTSAVQREGEVVALGYVRAEVAADAELSVLGARATMTPPTRP
jgi:folate-binding protein YgfZ